MDILDRLAGSVAFGFVYTLMYSGPFIVLWFVLGSPEGALGIVLGVFGLAGFLLASYRAKHAADSWAFEHMTFREAHRTSWVVVRTNLSFLPVVGRFFEYRKNATTHNRSVPYVIVVVIAIAVIGMAWHFFQPDDQVAASRLEDKNLPQIIDSTVKEEIIRRFAHHWRAGDARSIEVMFDLEAGKDLVDSLERWKSSLGDIVEGFYSHHQYVQHVDGQDFFQLYYSVRFEKQEGALVFQVYCNEDSYRLVGFGVVTNPSN